MIAKREWSRFRHVNCGELDVYSPRAHPISAVCPLWCTTPRTPAISDDILVRFVFFSSFLSGETLAR